MVLLFVTLLPSPSLSDGRYTCLSKDSLGTIQCTRAHGFVERDSVEIRLRSLLFPPDGREDQFLFPASRRRHEDFYFVRSLGISFHCSSGTLHFTRCVQQPWTSPASFWSWWTRSYLSLRFRRHSLRNERGYVLDVDLANVLGVVVVKLKQGLLVLTCWSYSRYFFTRLFRPLLSGPPSVVFVPAGS